MDGTNSVTSGQREALETARRLIRAGVPVFTAAPCPGETCTRPGHSDGTQEYDLPREWQKTVPSEIWLERWQPGHALAALGGLTADFLDVDPRNGGEGSEAEMRAAGQWPTVFGVAETPSGGNHYVISATGERKITGLMPGIDLQSGAAETDGRGHGRGFVWIAPTVRKSKVAPFEPREYRWLQEPDTDWLQDFENDESLQGLRTRIAAYRARGSAGHRGPGDFRMSREFTEEEARSFLRPVVEALETAEIGDIENRANNLAVALSHFVPDFWTHEFAFDVLRIAVAKTAYDPAHPAARWELAKFHPVIDNVAGRGPADAWRGVRRPEPMDAASVTDAVDELLAEMLSLGEVEALPPPKPLIDGLLNLDSESWIIGAPGTKKSFVVLDMAARVAAGQPWKGLETTRSGVVMIVAEGAGGMTLRVRAWRKIHGDLPKGVHILPRPVQAADRAAWSVLVEACRRLQPGLIVIDTQARTSVGLKENDATDMGVYVQAVAAIRQATGGCVLTVHHTGRAGGDARGSSAIDGAQHTELKVVSTGELTGELRTEKQKDMRMADPIALTFESVDLGLDDRGKPVDSLVLSTDPFIGASGVQPEPMEEWERGQGFAVIHLFKVLRDQGGTVGLTKAEARAAVVERFYGGDPKRLAKSTYYTAWKNAREKTTASGEAVMINVSGEKWAVDNLALVELEPGGFQGNQGSKSAD